VAQEKPLTLKRQKSKATGYRNTAVHDNQLQAEILIDTGVFHLEQGFSYLVPDSMQEFLTIGSVVKVPFREKVVLGIVLEIGKVQKSNLREIQRIVLSEGLTAAHIEFARAVSSRYACNFGQTLHLMLSGLGKIENHIPIGSAAIKQSLVRKSRQYVATRQRPEVFNAAQGYLKNNKDGSVLILFPTLKDLEDFSQTITSSSKDRVLEYGSHLGTSARKTNFQRIISERNLVVLGLRSSIFAPIQDLAQIVIIDEYSSNYYEQRAPYWNTRDVALLRSESEGCNLVFLSSSCSLELYRLIQSGWIKQMNASDFKKVKQSKIVFAPNTFHSTIREGLKFGSVLVTVSGRDYANGFVCAKCWNRARCGCGNFLKLADKGAAECVSCDHATSSWRCSECGESRTLVFRSGAKKIVEELGKAFPQERILLSTADKPLSNLEKQRSIVVAVYGNEPQIAEGYGGIVLLDGEFLVSRSFVRAEEDAFHKFFNTLSYSRDAASIFVSLPIHHPVSQAISAGKQSLFLESAMRDRSDTSLPPHVRIIRIHGEIRSLSALKFKLAEQFSGNCEIFTSQSGSAITIKVQQETALSCLAALKALQKLRSTSSKELFRIEVDPVDY
jgi:primosomal protein N' (replication factor Y)